ncbi:uncharacterized protein DFL_009724 [Arthrobotrys flagrans]|uniref:Uncharacterized protein n=1 Tax=Arthrobotrys flagrans TaxID=97331 RepID=A0A436ZSG5_ARTFL|nr:hypothetical protein DFL_009724 [Arthrobotrys flagrans]
MPLISTKLLVTTGLLILVPVSLIYTFHSSTSTGTIEPILTNVEVPISTVSAAEQIYSGRSLRKRTPGENADPGPPNNIAFAKQDNWKGIQISNRCSEGQKTSFRKGWVESGYLARVFKTSLEELKYERALGDYLGHAWKTNGFTQRITDNFRRIEALHSGGKEFKQTLEIYCDETDTPKEVLGACEKTDCCNGSPDGKEGGYFYVKQAPTTYAIVLCSKYFAEKTVQERAGALLASKPDNFDQIKQSIWALYPNTASIILHLQLHLPFAPSPSLYIGDAVDYYNPTGSANLSLTSADQSTRTAENYAMAALAAAQINIFGLEKAPSFEGSQNVKPEQKESKLRGVMDTAMDGQKKPGPKPSTPEIPEPNKAGLSLAFDGDLSGIIDTGANYTLPPLLSGGPLPKDLDGKVYRGIPSIH